MSLATDSGNASRGFTNNLATVEGQPCSIQKEPSSATNQATAGSCPGNVAMNAWPPQASYPCGNSPNDDFSGASLPQILHCIDNWMSPPGSYKPQWYKAHRCRILHMLARLAPISPPNFESLPLFASCFGLFAHLAPFRANFGPFLPIPYYFSQFLPIFASFWTFLFFSHNVSVQSPTYAIFLSPSSGLH